MLWFLALLPGLLSTQPPAAPEAEAARFEPGGPFADAIRLAQPRVVKIFGASLGAVHSYASGVLVSADGRVLTTLETLLEAPRAHVVLADGRRLPFTVLARDEARQLALLKIDAEGLPFFPLTGSQDAQPGDWVLAAANPFKVAVGPEPVSFSAGVLAARAPLAARRRAHEFAYDGQVLIVDVLVATPGSSGGALLDAQGNLIGLIGKAVESTHTNTWLNYALPAEALAAFVAQAEAGGPPPAAPDDEAEAKDARLRVARIGIRFFDLGARRGPAFLERVRDGSAAAQAGLRGDDLLLMIDQSQIATCEQAERRLGALPPGSRCDVTIKRGNEVLTLLLSVPETLP